jgi:hypothetical protein
MDSQDPAERRTSDVPESGTADGRLDDVDLLFSRLTQLSPPRNLAASVARAVHMNRPGRTQLAWAAAELVAVLVLGLLCFNAGQTLVGAGTLGLLGALARDASVIRLLPMEATLAVLETLPWIELGSVGLAGIGVAWCTRRLTRTLGGPGQRLPVAGGA